MDPLDQLEKLITEIEKAQMVDSLGNEIAQLFNVVGEVIIKIKEDLEKQISRDSVIDEEKIRNTLLQIQEVELRLGGRITETEQTLLQDFRKSVQQLYGEIKKVESRIPEAIDLSYLEQKIEDIENKSIIEETPNEFVQKINQASELISKDRIDWPEERLSSQRAGWGAHPLVIKSAGVVIDKVARIINFTGATVTRNRDGTINVAAGGGTPGGVNGDIQINASGVFGTIAGLNLNQTGNARGTTALDIQTERALVTEVASGNKSTAVGHRNTASGTYSIALGFLAFSGNTSTTAIGVSTTVQGSQATAVGYNNVASNTRTSAFGAQNVVSGNLSQGFGYLNTVSGSYATASGYHNIVTDTGAAFGTSNTVSAYGTTAVGINNTASGTYAIAVGRSNTASGLYSTAVGYASEATDGATAIGNRNTASGYGSTASGYQNTAAGARSVAIGHGNSISNVDDDEAVAIGKGNQITAGTGDGIAIGISNTSSHYFATAIGYGNTASGSSSVAIGLNVSNSTTNTLQIGPSNTTKTTIDASGHLIPLGSLKVATVGAGLFVKEGTNATMGTTTLNGVTAVTVSTNKVTANSRIQLTIQASGGTVGSPYVDTRSAGTSFNIKSTNVADSSTVAWIIFEPA